MTQLDLNKLRQEQAQTGKDLTQPQAGGGGDYAPPDAGIARLRLVGYVETGIHTTVRAGIKKSKPRCELHFELSGPKHTAKKLDDGTLIPHRIRVKEIVGTHEKNNYIKLFNLMNVDGDAKNFLDMLMEKAWLGTVSHYKFKGNDGKDRVIAQLRDKGAYQIRPTVFENPATGETSSVSVEPAISEPRVFLWDNPSLEQWDSLDKFSKETIKKAENFIGSGIYEMLIEAGREEETVAAAEESEQEPAADAAQDPDDPSVGAEPPADPTPPAKPAAKPAAKATPAKAADSPAKPAKPAGKAKAPAKDGDPLQGL